MKIGNIIRKHRKNKNLTQEEMAKHLGVTAPAVNKWENDHSFPDICLLSPIARLLNISLDTLLSHEKELSNIEANILVEQATKRLESEPFDQVFQWIKQCHVEYPNCTYLTLWMARVFDSQLQNMGFCCEEKYDSYILDSYNSALESDDEVMKRAAAESMYYFYIRKQQYDLAEKYIAYFSPENPERKRKQAIVFSKTGRQSEAYKAYEELLYSGYQSLNMTFHDIYMLALEEEDYDKARMIIHKIQELAHLFEFGKYHEISPQIELATIEKDAKKTLDIMEKMLTNLESIGDFTKSSLYSHMTFTHVSKEYLTHIRNKLMKGFRDEETYSYLKGNEQWINLVQQPEDLD